jgi:hypothetical protein
MPMTHTVAMHGIEVSELAGPEVLSYVEISQSAPGAGEVLIKAEAIGVGKSTFDASVAAWPSAGRWRCRHHHSHGERPLSTTGSSRRASRSSGAQDHWFGGPHALAGPAQTSE